MGHAPNETIEDRIDEALVESFPASDPPSWTLGGWYADEALGAKGAINASRHESLASPVLVHDLAAIAEHLRGQPTFRERGHNAATLVKHVDQRVVLLVLRAGALIHEHKAAGAASIQVISGRVRLRFSRDEDVELEPLQLVALKGGVQHEVEGLEDASLLLTLSWRPSQAHPPG